MADLKISQLTGATTPLDGTEVLPIVQSGATKKVANNDLRPTQIQSNATSGVLQITGPAAASTRVMTVPNANFTAARTDAAQTFTGVQTFTNGVALNATSTLNFSGITGTIALESIYPGASNAKTQLLFTGTGDYRQTLKIKLNKDQADNAPVDVWQWGPGVDATMSAGNLIQGTAAKGINFTANTGAAGMTSQLLNWYEEGTWTPNQGAGLTLVGAFSSAGTYTRIGRQVFIRGSVSGATSVAVASAGAITTNLPYSAAADATGTAINAANNASSILRVSSATLTAATAIAATTTITFSAVYSV